MCRPCRDLGWFHWKPVGILPRSQGITKTCRLSWLTNSAPAYEPKCGGGGGCGVSANKYGSYCCAHEAQINFRDLTPYYPRHDCCAYEAQINFGDLHVTPYYPTHAAVGCSSIFYGSILLYAELQNCAEVITGIHYTLQIKCVFSEYTNILFAKIVVYNFQIHFFLKLLIS